MRTKLGRWLGLAAASGILALAGCSSDAGGSGGGSGTADAFVGRYIDTLCGNIGPCCQALGSPFDANACKSNLNLFLGAEFRAADPAKYSYDAQAADECLAQVEASLRQCSTAGGEACDRAFTGTVASGGACRSSLECVADLACDEGICGGGAQAEGVEGDPCFWTCQRQGSGYSCGGTGPTADDTLARCFDDANLYCADTGLCTTRRDAGAACQRDHECAMDAHCDLGTCEPKAGEGGACRGDTGCQAGLYCKEQACVAELPLGSPCDAFDECAGGQCEDGTCVPGGAGGDIGLALICSLASAD
jgi:hypothetical protein